MNINQILIYIIMQDVQLGKVISILDLKRIDRLAADLKKIIKPLTVRYYRADLPVSLLIGGPKNPKKCAKGKANYVQMLWGDRRVLEFYGEDIRGNGHIFEENLGRKTDSVLETLAEHDMYTFSSWKRKNLGLRVLMAFIGEIDVFLGILILLSNPLLGIFCASFGAFLITLYTK
jgi:hypothetical protein